MEQPNMELIVDARRLYQKNPKLFKETVEIIKRFSPTMPTRTNLKGGKVDE